MRTSSKTSTKRLAARPARVVSEAGSHLLEPRGRTKQEARSALETYRARRDFNITPEPPPSTTKLKHKARKAQLEFVVQKHDATRLHYDVRIEIAGAMMSWAVPKGPSFDPTVKRLAVETEDHPMAYNRFEGRIPDGEYGGGDVLIWDRGTYETLPPGSEDAMRAKGHFHVRFFGEKLVGDWHFVRTHGRGGPAEGTKSQWLMFKGKDEHSDETKDIVAERPESVVSGKSATRGPKRRAASASGKSPAALLHLMGSPMRATLTAKLPHPESFSYEIKLDGYRLVAALAGGQVELSSRKGIDWTPRFPEVAQAIGSLSAREAVIDGEACILDDQGRSSFGMLQAWLGGDTARAKGTLAFAAFDLLWLDGRDLRGKPLEERRELLAALLKGAKAPLVMSVALDGSPAVIEKRARASGVEGLIAKRKGSTYASGGAGGWWKLKFRKEQEVALAGYVPRSDADDEVGALLIAVATGDGGFELAGKVGTGFDKQTRKKLAALLDRDRSKQPTVVGHPRVPGARWSNVKRVAQIALSEWTADGSARAASFLGLREDKNPEDCLREKDAPVKEKSEKKVRGASHRAVVNTSSDEKTKLSNPDKILFPRDGISKKEIALYYEQVSSVMLPYMVGRPIGLQRWPNGIDGEAWFEQNAPKKLPEIVRVVDVGQKHESKRKIVVDNAETLAWLANLAALTIHQWASHVPPATSTGRVSPSPATLEQADYAVLDLDPGDGTWADLIKVAETLRGLLEQLNLVSVVKTSGQRGLHVLIPVERGPNHEEVTSFARKLASAVAESLPAISTVERMKAKRRGRLYIDFLQNGSGKTIVAPYSIRARDGAPVSMPIAWSEVEAMRRKRAKETAPEMTRWNIRNVPKLLAKDGDCWSKAWTPYRLEPVIAAARSLWM